MWRYLWLGLLQGLTEFLPISSSAHLLLAQRWLGLGEPGHLLVAFAHLGTVFAVFFWFRRDLAELVRGLWRRERGAWRYFWALVIGTLPLGGGAFLVAGRMAQVFQATWIPIFLLANGLLLLGTAFGGRGRGPHMPSASQALGVGLAQLVAILPGLSRAGLTLAAGLRFGLGEREAFRFSFLLGIPAILGGVALAVLEDGEAVESWSGLVLTAGVAWGTGLLALALLAHAMRRRTLWPFGLYCFALGALALALA